LYHFNEGKRMELSIHQRDSLQKMGKLMLGRIKELVSITNAGMQARVADFQASVKKMFILGDSEIENQIVLEGLMSKAINKYDDLESDLIDELEESEADEQAIRSEKLNDVLVDLADNVDKKAAKELEPVTGSASIALQSILTFDGAGIDVSAFVKKTAAERLRARKLRLKYMRTAAGRAAMRRARLKAKMRRRMHKRPNAQRSRLMKLVHRSYGY
jgi:hypothetical protein